MVLMSSSSLFAVVALVLCLVMPARGAVPALTPDETQAAASLAVLSHSESPVAEQTAAAKTLRQVLEKAAFGNAGPVTLRLNHALAYRSLPQIINLMSIPETGGAFSVMPFLQGACLGTSQPVWREWLAQHKTAESILWSWPDLPVAEPSGK